MWVWVLSFTILGSVPEHGKIAKFQTRQECQRALIDKKLQEETKKREVVGTCYFTKLEK